MPIDLLAATPSQPRDLLAETQQAPVGEPSVMDRLQTNPVIGAPLQGLLRGGQGIEQLLAHGAASASDLGGVAPNSLSKMLHAIADHVDSSIGAQNQGYEQAGKRVDAASTNPELSSALRTGGEFAGSMINPAGRAGQVVSEVKALGPVANAAIRGGVSGGAIAATQPVADVSNFYGEKAKQVGTGVVAGGVTGGVAERVGGVKASPAPSTKDLKDAASTAYKAAEKQGVAIEPNSFKIMATDIRAEAEKAGLDENLTPKSTAVLTRFDKEVAPGVPITLEKAETLRRVALSALDSPEKNDRRIAHLIIDGLDDKIAGLKAGDLTGGNAPEALASLKDARGLYARSAKSADIDRLVEKAKNAVGANYTAAGMDTALRQQFRAVANNQNAFGRFSKDEQAAILKIVRGSGLQNTLRLVGKLSPNSTFPIASELAVAGSGHGDVAAGMALAGAVSKHAAAKMGQSNVNALSDLVRRGPNGSAAPGPSPNGLVWNPLPALAANALLQPSPK